MSDREARIKAFLEAHGWGDADRERIAGDASFRKYDRLTDGDATAILMDAPPPMEDVRPFVRVADHLTKLGFTVPVVRAKDEEAGLLLLADLGNATYTRLIAGGYEEMPLYGLAVDTLIALHKPPVAQAVPTGTARYDEAHFLAEAQLLPDWFLPAMTGRKTDPDVLADYLALWREVHAEACDMPETLVLRDFHVDNLMIVDGAKGIHRCGLLDFQDALRGPVTYDLMSLLEDARRDIDSLLIDTLKGEYLDAFPDIDRDDFDRSWAIWAAQRHAKVIGIFTRLKVRDHKSLYLDHIPRVWRLLEQALDHPSLASIKTWFDTHVPRELRTRPDL